MNRFIELNEQDANQYMRDMGLHMPIDRSSSSSSSSSSSIEECSMEQESSASSTMEQLEESGSSSMQPSKTTAMPIDQTEESKEEDKAMRVDRVAKKSEKTVALRQRREAPVAIVAREQAEARAKERQRLLEEQEEQEKKEAEEAAEQEAEEEEERKRGPPLLAWPLDARKCASRAIHVDPAIFCSAGGADQMAPSGGGGSNGGDGTSPLESALQAAAMLDAEPGAEPLRFGSLGIGSFFGFSLVFVLRPSDVFLERRENASFIAMRAISRSLGTHRHAGDDSFDSEAFDEVHDHRSEERDFERLLHAPRRLDIDDRGADAYWKYLLRKYRTSDDGCDWNRLCERESEFRSLVEALDRLAAAVGSERLESLHFDASTGRFHMWISEPVLLSDSKSGDAAPTYEARRQRAIWYMRRSLNLESSDVDLLSEALLSRPFGNGGWPHTEPVFRNVANDTNCDWCNMIVAPRCKLASHLAPPPPPSSAEKGGKRKQSSSSNATPLPTFLQQIQKCARVRERSSVGPFLLRMWQSLVEQVYAVDASSRLLAQYGVASINEWITRPPTRGGLNARVGGVPDVDLLLKLATPDAHLRKTIVGWLVARQRTIDYANQFVARLRDAGGFIVSRVVAESQQAEIQSVRNEIEAANALPHVSLWTLDWAALADKANEGVDLHKNAAALIAKHKKCYRSVFAYWHAAGETACRAYNALYFRPRASAGLERALPWLATRFAAEQRHNDNESSRGNLNRWSGHAIEYDDTAHLFAPRQPRARWLAPAIAYLWHLYRHVCGARMQDFAYVVRWFACTLQEPYARCKQALLLMGVPGTGKGLSFQAQTDIIGERHTEQIGRAEHELLGQFNPMLRDRTLVFADEFCEPRDPGQRAILKGLITEGTYTSRTLYSPAKSEPSYIRLVMASNDRKPVQLDRCARRYVVLNVEPVSVGHVVTQQLLAEEDATVKNDERLATAAFYTLVGKRMNVKDDMLGLRALALLQYRADLRKHNRHAPAPQTPGLVSLVQESMDPIDRWFHNVLCRGYHVTTTLPPNVIAELELRRNRKVFECEERRRKELGPEPTTSDDPDACVRYRAQALTLKEMAESDVPPVNKWTKGWLEEAQMMMLFRSYAKFINNSNGSGAGDRSNSPRTGSILDANGRPLSGGGGGGGGGSMIDPTDYNSKVAQQFFKEAKRRYFPDGGKNSMKRVTVWMHGKRITARGIKMPPLKVMREMFCKRIGFVSFGDEDDEFDDIDDENDGQEQIKVTTTPVKKQKTVELAAAPAAPEILCTPEPRALAQSPSPPSSSSSSSSSTPGGFMSANAPEPEGDGNEEEEKVVTDFASIEEFQRAVLEALWPAEASGDDPLFAGADGHTRRWQRVLRDLELRCFSSGDDDGSTTWCQDLSGVLEAAHQVALKDKANIVPLESRRLTWLPTTSRDEKCALLQVGMSAAAAEQIVDACEAAASQSGHLIMLVFYPGPETLYFGDLDLASNKPTVHLAVWSSGGDWEQPTFAVLERATN